MAIIKIKIIPGASRNEIVGMWQDMVKIKVTAQPESGRANEACIKLLSEKLDVKMNRIEILRGLKSREKVVEVRDLDEVDLSQRLCYNSRLC